MADDFIDHPDDPTPEEENPQKETSTTEENNAYADIDLADIIVDGIKPPLLIFFGPRNVGKTVTLLRFCHYIRKQQDCKIRPNPDFWDNTRYAKSTERFEEMLMTQRYAPDATGEVDFLLLDVMRKGRRFCQILEAPGEHFFDTSNPQRHNYPSYLKQIFMADYKKIFFFFFSPSMMDAKNRTFYANQIVNLLETHTGKQDKIAFLYNKVDKTDFFSGGGLQVNEVKREFVSDEANTDLLSFLKRSRQFRFNTLIPFSAGSFEEHTNEIRQTWLPSDDRYPKNMWKQLLKLKEGSWWSF